MISLLVPEIGMRKRVKLMIQIFDEKEEQNDKDRQK